MRKIRKRDGVTLQPFDQSKIETAVRKAGGVSAAAVAAAVAEMLSDDVVDVEAVQDAVEVELMRRKHFDVAKAYVLYRHERNEARKARRKPDANAVSDYIHFAKYARHSPELGRRELYHETVARVEAMHLRRFPVLEADIRGAFDLVRDKRVLPSMRTMQFAGVAIEQNNARAYNCSFSLVDRPRVFQEALFLLLSGCGVGYSVQFEHVEQLPALMQIDTNRVVHHIVDDSIEGWADALGALIHSYLTGAYVEFAFHGIREKGAPLRVSGGRAPGHIPLKKALDRIRGVLDGAQGRRLRPIECHDILCHAADAVLSGGIRRSAMIALFSLDDGEMLHAKIGNWHQHHPWRANANNSIALLRESAQEKSFRRAVRIARDWGEPGVVFVSNPDYGTNPCAEISLNPVLYVDGKRHTGFAFCNLTEINAARLTSKAEFLESARAATIIGTLQASYTSFPYLGWVSEQIARREALLGVGMTGIMDAPVIALDPATQREVAEQVVAWNARCAALIGIEPAARTTTVKPSGTTSLALGCVGSGIHPHHARRYFRRVIADELEVVFAAFRERNPHMCVRRYDGKWVIEFPVEAPEGAITVADLGAVEFLKRALSTQVNWVLPGTARPESSPGLNHNVSTTCVVRPHEWDDVASFIWTNRDKFTGVTLLAHTGDKDYPFAPREAVSTPADEARWNQLIAGYEPVDYTAVREAEDTTTNGVEPACAGGACEI